MAKGKVKWFNDSKGFGFITPTKAVRLVCPLFRAHYGRFQNTEGRPGSTFDVTSGPKGKQASNVQSAV